MSYYKMKHKSVSRKENNITAPPKQALYVVSKWLTCVPRFFEILQSVKELQSGHEISHMTFDP